MGVIKTERAWNGTMTEAINYGFNLDAFDSKLAERGN